MPSANKFINHSSNLNELDFDSKLKPQNQNQPSSRYKTELCRPFEEFSTCKYGDKCQFAHGQSELRSLNRHPKYKTELCRTFHTLGLCPYGHRCHFIHNSEEEIAIYQQLLLQQQQQQQQRSVPPALVYFNGSSIASQYNNSSPYNSSPSVSSSPSTSSPSNSPSGGSSPLRHVIFTNDSDHAPLPLTDSSPLRHLLIDSDHAPLTNDSLLHNNTWPDQSQQSHFRLPVFWNLSP